MKNSHSTFLFLMLCCIATFAGCGGADGPEIAAVTGTVKLNGEPLPNVVVIFNPENARPSEGRTNETGFYELQYTRDKTGAIVGPHKVVITSKVGVDAEGNEIANETEVVPEQYNSSTTLTKEVKPGLNTFDFDLEG